MRRRTGEPAATGPTLPASVGGAQEGAARALSFTTLIVANLGLILANRSWTETILATLRRPNAALWWVVGGATAFLALALGVPPLRELFHFAAVGPAGLTGAVAAGLLAVAGIEAVKLVFAWRAGSTPERARS